MKKIFLVANIQYTLTQFRGELIQQLRSMGHQVFLVCPNADGNLYVDPDPHTLEIPLSRGGVNPFKDFQTFKVLAALYRKEKPDIVINYTIKPIIYSSLAAGIFSPKTKIFSNITGLGYVFTHQSFKARLIRLVVMNLYRISLMLNTRIFFQNPDDESLFRSLKIIWGQKVKRINGSGINLARLSYQEQKKEKQSFVFVGRLLKDKGLTELVSAVKSLSNKYPQMKCYIIGGNDPENPNSFTQIEIDEFAKCPSLIFLGHQKDAVEILKGCEVNVLPSYREGTPRSNLEAMALGLPIITTDAPGCRETVKDGFNGFLVPVKNYQSLAEKMEYFLQNPEMIQIMGKRSREYVEQKFNVIEVNNEVIKTLGL